VRIERSTRSYWTVHINVRKHVLRNGLGRTDKWNSMHYDQQKSVPGKVNKVVLM
jgi:hypothetical protein